MNWIEVADVLMASGLVVFGSYRIGVQQGLKRREIEQAERRASMLRHPSYHLRIKE